MPISRESLPNLTISDVVKHFTESNQQEQLNAFIEKNALKLDRLKKLGDYCATLIYERDPTVPMPEPIEPSNEKQKQKTLKKKNVT